MSAAVRALALAPAISLIACAPPPAPPQAATPPPAAPAQAPAPPPIGRRSSGLQVVLDLGEKNIPVSLSRGDPSLDLRPLRGRTFVAIQDVLFYVDGDALRADPALQSGLSDLPRPAYLSVMLGAMGGRWPDAAWIQVAYRGDRTFSSTFLRHGDGKWVAGAGDRWGVATEILPLAGGWSAVFLGIDPFGDWSHGAPKDVLLLHPRWSVPVRVHEKADSIAALPDGSLYLAADGRVTAWAPDGSPRRLPSPAYGTRNRIPVVSSLVVSSPTSIWMLNRLNTERGKTMDLPPTKDPPRPERQLLHFDGQSWRIERVPVKSPDRIFAGPRGALWVGQEKALYERAADGTWASLEVPGRIDQVWVAGDDDVWATSGGTLLLHTRPLPPGDDLVKLAPPPVLPRFSAECQGLTALLDEVPRTTPEDFDFRPRIARLTPALGKLAKRFAFYDVRVGGERRLVAHVASMDQSGGYDAVAPAGEALIAAAKKAGASSARLVCAALPDGVDAARLVRAAAAAPEADAPRPASVSRPVSLDGCATPMVVLFAPAKTAPKDFDFPLTRRAITGHSELSKVRFFDFQRRGKRVIVATAPDKKEALALADLIRRSLPGSAPAPVCERAPSAAREIRVDLATGKVKK